MPNSLTAAIAQLEQTEQDLTTQLEATRQALTSLRIVAGVPTKAERQPRPSKTKRQSRATSPSRVPGRSTTRQERSLQLLAVFHADRPAALDVITDAVTPQAGQTPKQHATAVRNGLQRLRRAHLVENVGRGEWGITAKGRAAVAAAKEAP